MKESRRPLGTLPKTIYVRKTVAMMPHDIAGPMRPREVLNDVDGQRTASDIRDLVSAEDGPVPLDVVVEFLRALVVAGAVRQKAWFFTTKGSDTCGSDHR